MIYSISPPTELLLLGADRPTCLSQPIAGYCKVKTCVIPTSYVMESFSIHSFCRHQGLVMVQLMQVKVFQVFFSINAGDKLKIKTGGSGVLSSVSICPSSSC